MRQPLGAIGRPAGFDQLEIGGDRLVEALLALRGRSSFTSGRLFGGRLHCENPFVQSGRSSSRKSRHAATQQAADGGVAAAELPGDRRHRLAFQVFELHGAALVLGQLGQCLGQAQQAFAGHGPLAGRRIVGREPGLQARGRPFELRLQGALLAHVALGAMVGAWRRRSCRPAFAAANRPARRPSGRGTGPACGGPPGGFAAPGRRHRAWAEAACPAEVWPAAPGSAGNAPGRARAFAFRASWLP